MSTYCVVLNTTYDPLAVIPSEKALVLVLEGKAYVNQVHPTRKFRSIREEFDVPTEIVLKKYQRTGAKYYKRAQLNQRNLFIRDGYTCGYCDRHAFELTPAEYLTRDHVHPQSKGGPDDWTNVVTACSTCNHRKDDKSVADAGLTLLVVPREPTVFEILRKRQLKNRRKKPAA
jgi:5-methylcytosine-specific restriction endonuclease McrA